MLKGIDVSNHNGSIDWNAIKNDGIEFAIIRLGWGSDEPGQDDPNFFENVKGCEEVGLPYGIYLYSYALNYDNLNSEIDHALRLAKGCNPTLGIWFDMEDADSYKNDHGVNVYDNADMMNDFCNKFCAAMEDAGYKTGTYCNEDYCRNVVTDLHYPLWLAIWGPSEPSRDCLMWQYTSDGQVNGNGSSRMDMNYYYGDIPSVTPDSHEPSEEPTPAEPTHVDGVVNVGDKVKVINAVTYDGQPFTTYYDEYDVIEVKGDRVVIGIGDTVTAAINVSNLNVGASSAAEPSQQPQETPAETGNISVGSKVRFTGSVSYDGVGVTSYHDVYEVIELKGDRAVLAVDGVVFAAVNVADCAIA